VKVCSASHIEHLVKERAGRRWRFTYVAAPPGAIPIKAQLSVLQHQPIGRGLGKRFKRAPQSGGLRPDDLPHPQLELIYRYCRQAG